jgi:hypothetical protein
MGVRPQISKAIRIGQSPSDIANSMSRKTKDIVNLILLQVGERELQLSDVLFTIPHQRQRQYEAVLARLPDAGSFSWEQSCRARRLDYGEFKLFLVARDSLHGDMYRYLRDLEVSLHQRIRKELERAFPAHDDAWWREGVPLAIRQRCVTTKEAEPEQISDPFAYTNLIDLKKILETNWAVFKGALPKSLTNNRQELLTRFDKLNNIRNGVMHPIKPIPIEKEDFIFVREMHVDLVDAPWQFDASSTIS